MKPLSEKLKELDTDRTYAFNHYGDNSESYRAFDAGMNHAVELLQAWLREADEWVDKNTHPVGSLVGLLDAEGARRDLLGTTQKGKQEGEK